MTAATERNETRAVVSPPQPPSAAAAFEQDRAPGAQVASSTTQRVIRGALILLTTQPITWASSLLLVIFVPRLLDSRSLGEYAMAVSLEGVLLGFLSLGIPSVLTRRLASNPETAKADMTTAFTLLVGLGALGALATLAVVASTAALPISTPLLALVLLIMVVTQAQTVLHAALTGFQAMGRYAWSNAVTTAATAILAIAILSLGGGVLGFAAAGLVPLVCVTAFFWLRLRIGFDRAGVRWSALVSMALMGLPFLGWDVLVRLRTEGESLVLGAMLSVETVGWWAAALRVVSIPIFVPVLIVTPLMPALSQIVDRPWVFASTLRRSFELTLIVTVGVSAGIFAFAPVVPGVLGWAPEYEAAVPLMQALVLFFPLLSMGMVFGAALVALGAERRLLIANVFATVVQYSLLVLTVPIAADWWGNGAMGAAIARVAAESVMLVAAQLFLPRGTLTLGTWLFAVRVLAAGVALAGVVTLVLPLVGPLWPLAGVAGALAYVASLFLLRTVRVSDVRTALGWVTERLHRPSTASSSPS